MRTATHTEQSYWTLASRAASLPASRLATNQVAGLAQRKTPHFIPADEVYYWSSPWQRDAIESMQALRAGEFEEFNSDDPTDAARWLLSLDEDDC